VANKNLKEMGKTVSKERKNVRQKSSTDKFSLSFIEIMNNTSLSTKEKQNELRKLCYAEASRYRENAKKYLLKADIDNEGFYGDKKYVKTACGVAYSGLLIAIECFLTMKGVKIESNTIKDFYFYTYEINKIDKKIAKHYISAYDSLHKYGYYDGTTNSIIIKDGFKELDVFIELINPNKN
jgi:hypothetical protein